MSDSSFLSFVEKHVQTQSGMLYTISYKNRDFIRNLRQIRCCSTIRIIWRYCVTIIRIWVLRGIFMWLPW